MVKLINLMWNPPLQRKHHFRCFTPVVILYRWTSGAIAPFFIKPI
ncbi:MAG: hypothetical protein AB4080_24295 [Trichodesmium sp.]